MANSLQYSTANFTVSGGVVDAEQLRQEFAAASFLSTPVVFSHLDVNQPGSTPRVLVWFNTAPNGTDTDTADAIVAAHTGLGHNLVLVPPPGVFEVPHDRVRGRFIVGSGGAVDYSSIKGAIDAAIAAGAGPTTWYVITVYPGIYFEDPMSVPMGVYITGQAGVVVLPTTPTESLFTLFGGVVSDVTAGGVTGPTEAVFKTTTPYVINAVLSATVHDCSHGFLASGAGVDLLLLNVSAAIDPSGIGITTALLKAENGAHILGTNMLVTVPAVLVPFFAGNPIEKVVWADTGSLISLTTGVLNVAAKNSSQVATLADGGSTVVYTAMTIENCHTALKIGAGGTGSKIIAQGSSLRTNTVDFSIQSSTGLISASCAIDHAAVTDIITGGILTGTFLDTADATTQTRGTADYVYTTGREVSLPDFYHGAVSTGLTEGGVVTGASGLTVDVSAGSGWVARHAPLEDLVNVSWSATAGLALTASALNYVYYDGANLTGINVSTSQPGAENIQLAIVVTSAVGVRFNHAAAALSHHIQSCIHDYLIGTRKFATNSGLVTSQGSGPTKLSVGAGSYYRALNVISYGGSGGDATWSYFYNTNGAAEVASVTALNLTQYDNAGTLTSMTAGFYRSDTLVLTSDGRLSLIYGTTEYSTQALAEVAGTGSVPTFMEESAICLALVVVRQGVGIASILDARPRPGTSTGLGAGGSGVTDHGDLSGLQDDDHTQYLLAGGSRAMGGNLALGGNSIVSVNLVDGVDVSAHAARHNAGAADALATATAVAALIGQSSAEGSAAFYARSDHTHAHAGGAPVGVSKVANAEGVATTFSRADHKHDVATAAPGTTGVAVVSADGSATTLARSDHTHQSNTAPVNVTKAAAAIGISGEPARADHKHDVTTAAPGAMGIATASGEGVATTLARSDHTHQSNTAPVSVTKAAAAIGTSGEAARADHKHDVTTATPVQGIGAGNSEGTATSLARSDHNHKIRETAGPTELTIGAIADGQLVFRSGSVLLGVGLQDIQGMRLTGVSATPVMKTDNTNLATIYLTPHRSNQISLYDGARWLLFSTPEVSLAVTGRTTDLPFDIFAYSSGGVVTLEFANWLNSTTRATAIVRCDGVWCRSGDLTRRYLGTCRPRSATTYSWVSVGTDAPARFDLWNVDNKVEVTFDLTTTANTWAYTIATWRQAQGVASYQVDVVAGLEDCRLLCLLTVTSRSSAAVGGNSPREVGVGFDSTTVPIGIVGSSGSTGGIHQISQATGVVLCPPGRHFAAWLEVSQAASVTTWVGDDGGTRIVSGMQGTWVC